MKPVHFKGHNAILGEGQEEYQNLPVFVEPNDPQGKVAQCWEFTDEEVEGLKKTKQMWVMQMTFKERLQPILLSVEPLVTFPDSKEG